MPRLGGRREERLLTDPTARHTLGGERSSERAPTRVCKRGTGGLYGVGTVGGPLGSLSASRGKRRGWAFGPPVGGPRKDLACRCSKKGAAAGEGD